MELRAVCCFAPRVLAARVNMFANVYEANDDVKMLERNPRL